jgi:diguanylate cyclase (GGDEF)-like protein
MVTLQQGIPQQDVIMGVHKPNDELTWISINSAPLFRLGEDTPYAVVATFDDITERCNYEHMAQKQLDELNDLYQQLERRQEELAEINRTLAAQATVDGLTGLKNHRKLREDLAVQYHQSIRYHVPLSVILLDVDYFKRYNDTYGHPAGDMVLKQIAQVLQDAARRTDCVARYGGEEFAIILPHTDYEGACALAERFRALIEQAPWSKRAVTISMGISTLWPGTQSDQQLIDEADKALYHSKRWGRNRITHFSDCVEKLEQAIQEPDLTVYG